jgi:hypothetical protein
MKKAERTERLRSLALLAQGILRRRGETCYSNRGDGRYKFTEFRFNEIKISRARGGLDDNFDHSV